MDFRTYLQGVDPNALAYTGNDARIDPTKSSYVTGPSAGVKQTYGNTGFDQENVQKYITGLYQKYLNPTPTKSIDSIYGGTPRPVYAPKLDVAAVNAKARQQAEGAANPFYTKVLNDFLAQQAFNTKQTKTQYDTNVKNYEDQLKNTLEQNAITKTRTGEDVAQNIADVNQNADQFQTDSGQAFDAQRLDLARNTSTGGLGQQKLETAQTTRNTQESRQVQKFQAAKDQQELFKTRSFDDLARSGKLAGESATKGKTAAKFDLDTYIQNAAFTEKDTRNKLEQSRQDEINQKARSYAKDAYASYIRNIVDPAQRLAGVAQYGSSF